MILALSNHEELERILLFNGLNKQRVLQTGALVVYTQQNNRVISYTTNQKTQKEMIYLLRDGEIKSAEFAAPWLFYLLRDKYTKKHYKVKRSKLSNGVTEADIFYVESGDTRVMTGVEGIDHAQEIFEDLEIEVKPNNHSKEPEHFLLTLFSEYILHK
ncbi:hypothetical protein NEFER03_1627 [Nematocida sp. LUAm3]|nr:hypothetical protein NEFER03_1627 [Nematocida sp. LUAm3]KAI5176113.1 hypothetical protein NEFER02_1934 [Nematocida sp. LUAm2]KAI5179001.1 hypothetical protein NEFER01_1877 [Nematocida sp. LUAm1]